MNDSKMQIFATRLKELRTDNGMTQKEFAQKIGVTPAALSAYENNQKNHGTMPPGKSVSD